MSFKADKPSKSLGAHGSKIASAINTTGKKNLKVNITSRELHSSSKKRKFQLFFEKVGGSEKSLWIKKCLYKHLLGAGVLGNGFGALGNSMLGQLPREQ